MMTGVNHVGKSEINRRKTVSDVKNNTDRLIFEDTKSNNKNAAAYRGVRNHKDDKLIASMKNISNNDYFEGLFNSID